MATGVANRERITRLSGLEAARVSAVLPLVTLLAACGGGGGAAQAPAPTPNTLPNRPPVLSSSTASARAVVLHPFSYDASSQGPTATDPDGDALTYTLTPASGTWLSASGSRLQGTPTAVGHHNVYVDISDGRGGTVSGTIEVTVAPNSPPTATRRNGPVLVEAGAHVNYDATRGGTAITDPDGTALTYELTMLTPSAELSVVGTTVVGSMASVGAVNFKLSATDTLGARGEDVFSIVVPGPEPGQPTLPAVSHDYEDRYLPLPPLFQAGPPISTFYDRTPGDNPITNAGATLGRVLFYDKRLSSTNTHACSSCHEQQRGFASAQRFDNGVTGVPLTRNAMGLTNVRYNRLNLYFSDERVESLERLVLMPIESATELGNSIALLEQKLAATRFYPPLFEAAFGSRDITGDRIAKALAQFLRALISYRSKHDEALSSSDPTLVYTAAQLRGSQLFRSEDVMQPRCSFCHITDVQIIFGASNNGLDAAFTDPGAGGGAFRTASLRNIAVTGPYMHDGRFATLREVIDHYEHGIRFSADLHGSFVANGQARVITLSEEDKIALEEFLHTLTDTAFLTDPRFSDPFD
jgi:cytochrome c peroxidase